MNYKIRPIDYDHDLPVVVAMLDRVMTNGMTIEGFRAGAESPAPINRNSAAVNAAGEIVGWSLIRRSENEPPNRAFLSIIAHPNHRRSGVGTSLIAEAKTFCQSIGITELKSRVKDDEPGWNEWAKSNGFKIERHSFRSSITLADFDLSEHPSRISELVSERIVFSTLAELGDTTENRRKYYEADSAAAIDIPGEDHVESWTEYEAEVFNNKEYRPEGAHLALDGERIVGVAHVWLDAEHDRMENAFTGVIREYRGRGIATALKLLTIKHARNVGVSEILTENDSENAPILAVNRKLGYKPWPGAYGLKASIG